MSTPRTLTLPVGVEAVTLETARGPFAAHVVRPSEPVAHVVLIPGWTGSKEDFTPLLPLLADAGFAATAYDQRGQLETPGAPDDDYTLSGLGIDAVAVAACVTTDPVHLLGHSFGGLVAQTAAVEHADVWRSLSLLCTGPAALGSTRRRPLPRIVAALRGDVPLQEIYRTLRGATLGTHPPEIEAFLERRFASNSRVALAAFTQHLDDAPDRVDEVAATGLPAWVGRGVGDDQWPHAAQDDLAARLGTHVHTVPDAEHSPAVENPEGLAREWVPFLRSVP